MVIAGVAEDVIEGISRNRLTMMKRQIGFAEAEIAGKKRVTRRQRFLAEMEKVVPWQRLLSAIEPHYPKGKTGRPPFPVATMLRIHFMHVWTRRVLQASFVT